VFPANCWNFISYLYIFYICFGKNLAYNPLWYASVSRILESSSWACAVHAIWVNNIVTAVCSSVTSFHPAQLLPISNGNLNVPKANQGTRTNTRHTHIPVGKIAWWVSGWVACKMADNQKYRSLFDSWFGRKRMHHNEAVAAKVPDELFASSSLTWANASYTQCFSCSLDSVEKGKANNIYSKKYFNLNLNF